MYNMLRGKNSGLLERAINFASKLVKLESRSLNEQKVAEAVEQEMLAVGYDKVFRDKAGNVVGVISDHYRNPAVLLCSHMDTVSVDENDGWTEAPYSGVVKNGLLFGRGASDCKSGLAAQVYAGALIKRSLLPMRGTLITAATVAEENGLSFGMRALLNETLPELGIKPDFAVLGEPTGLGFYYGHDGWMEMDLKLEGSNIFHIQDAASIISSQIKADYPERNTGEYELQAPEFQAGKSASIRLKLRLNSSEKAQEVVTRVENRAHMASQSAGIMAVNGFLRKETKNMYTGSSSQALHNVPAWLTDPFHPMMETARQSLAAAGCAVRTGKWKLKNLGMGTAGGLLWNDFGIPTIGYGPGQEEMAHAVNECVAVKSIEEAIYGSAVMAHGIAGIPVCGWTLDEI